MLQQQQRLFNTGTQANEIKLNWQITGNEINGTDDDYITTSDRSWACVGESKTAPVNFPNKIWVSLLLKKHFFLIFICISNFTSK